MQGRLLNLYITDFWAQCDIAIANGIYSILFSEEVPVNNSYITPTSANFDKKEENQNDIGVTLTLNGNTFIGIKSGNSYLLEGEDYSIIGDLVTIKKEFLAEQSVGTLSLVFEFSAGIPRTLTVTIVDTTDVEET